MSDPWYSMCSVAFGPDFLECFVSLMRSYAQPPLLLDAYLRALSMQEAAWYLWSLINGFNAQGLWPFEILPLLPEAKNSRGEGQAKLTRLLVEGTTLAYWPSRHYKPHQWAFSN